MARTHHVTTRMPVEVAFACAACGFSAEGIVEGEGHGTATSFIVLDRKHARAAAAEQAVAEARHDAQLVASIAPCPRCHERSSAAVASFAVRSTLAVTGYLAVGAAAFWLLDGWWSWLGLGVLVAAAGLSARRRRARFVLASQLLRDLRPKATLPRAEVRALPPARPPAPSVAPPRIEPTPATDEPRTLR